MYKKCLHFVVFKKNLDFAYDTIIINEFWNLLRYLSILQDIFPGENYFIHFCFTIFKHVTSDFNIILYYRQRYLHNSNSNINCSIKMSTFLLYIFIVGNRYWAIKYFVMCRGFIGKNETRSSARLMGNVLGICAKKENKNKWHKCGGHI